MNGCMERLCKDISQLVQSGFSLPNGEKCCVRLVQYRADALERHNVMCLYESFTKTKFFSSFTYVTTEDRLKAKSVEDLLPERCGRRTESTYDADVLAANLGDDVDSTHCTKGMSELNSIPFFHCVKTGTIPPCVKHDVFAGIGRKDCAFVVRYLFAMKLLSKEEMIYTSNVFKRQTLTGHDKTNWISDLKEDSFKFQLGGTMTQNASFIRFCKIAFFLFFFQQTFW